MNKFSKIYSVLALSFALCGSLCAQNERLDVKVRSNERWWGFDVYASNLQPFTDSFKGKSLVYLPSGGFTTSLLFSSDGRYVWSNESFELDYKKDNFSVNSENKLKLNKGGRNLREAFLVSCHKNFPPRGELKSAELVTSVVYETKIELGLYQTQDKVLDYAQKIKEEGFPSGVIVLSNGWQTMGCDLDFNNSAYPDPQGFINSLDALGFKLMLTVTPLIVPSGANFLTFRQNNLLVKDSNGEPLIIKTDAGYYACLNISLPEVSALIKKQLAALRAKYKFAGFRFDAYQVLPYFTTNGEIDAFMNQWLSLDAEGELTQFMPAPLKAHSNEVYGFRYNDVSKLIPMVNNVVSAGLANYAFCQSLLQNINTEDDAPLSAYLGVSAFMPVATIDFAPWRIKSSELKNSVKRAFELRANMKNELNKTIKQIEKTSEPLVTNMEYNFAKTGFADCLNQFVFANKYLVIVPDYNSNNQLVRLPRGIWKTPTGQTIKGPVVRGEKITKGEILYYELIN